MKQVCLNIYNYRKELESLYLQNNLKLLPHLLNLNRPISFSSQLVQKKKKSQYALFIALPTVKKTSGVYANLICTTTHRNRARTHVQSVGHSRNRSILFSAAGH